MENNENDEVPDSQSKIFQNVNDENVSTQPHPESVFDVSFL